VEECPRSADDIPIGGWQLVVAQPFCWSRRCGWRGYLVVGSQEGRRERRRVRGCQHGPRKRQTQRGRGGFRKSAADGTYGYRHLARMRKRRAWQTDPKAPSQLRPNDADGAVGRCCTILRRRAGALSSMPALSRGGGGASSRRRRMIELSPHRREFSVPSRLARRTLRRGKVVRYDRRTRRHLTPSAHAWKSCWRWVPGGPELRGAA